MVQRDLEKAGIPYETEEGIADFHAAGRHSHVTGLLRNGATLVEAKELARHTDVRMTMKYTHIGLQDQAKALANLPVPNADRQRPGSVLDGISGPSETLAGKAAPACTPPHKTTNPRGSGGCVADCPDLSLVDKQSEEWRQQDANRTFPSRRIRLGQHDSGTVQ